MKYKVIPDYHLRKTGKSLTIEVEIENEGENIYDLEDFGKELPLCLQLEGRPRAMAMTTQEFQGGLLKGHVRGEWLDAYPACDKPTWYRC
ncbi:hypothetical protein ACLOJK_009376 [Asimina triloba]